MRVQDAFPGAFDEILFSLPLSLELAVFTQLNPFGHVIAGSRTGNPAL